MLLFGHKFIKSEKFFHISDIDSIEKTPSSSNIYLEFSEDNLDIIEFLKLNEIVFGLYVKTITEVIYASALDASYIIVNKRLAKSAQNIAQNYLFDAKILAHIDDEDEIEEMALLGLDGIIFQEAIVKVNS
jgi:hypothetical protein